MTTGTASDGLPTRAAPDAAHRDAGNVLELRRISKIFGATQALDDVDLTVRHGEVLALLGENGSGKSSLVKVLAGVYVPEPGAEFSMHGQDISFPLDAGASRELGISFVHQDLGLAGTLTVLENLMLSRQLSAIRINWREERRRAAEMLRSYGISVDPLAVVNKLPPVEQALVAIARAAEELRLHRELTGVSSSVLVLDEPTVFLPENETEFLFRLIRNVVEDGASVVFISHDLPAVKEVADRTTVLRNGRVAAHTRVKGLNDDDLVELIVGAPAEVVHERRTVQAEDRAATDDEPLLAVRDLGGRRVAEFDLEVRPGEIVGLAGLLGSGAEDVPYLLFGAHQAAAGTMTLNGETLELPAHTPQSALHHGISFIPADRRREAIAPTVSVAENMMLLAIERFRRAGLLRPGLLRDSAGEKADLMDIRPRRTDIPVGTLSGGNAQKVVVAKWLETSPNLLLLHEPTQGVDVGARSQIYQVIREAAESGTAVIWVASDFDELATVCDRVVIVNEGRTAAELTGTAGEPLTQESITAAVFSAGSRTSSSTEHTSGSGSEGGTSHQERTAAHQKNPHEKKVSR